MTTMSKWIITALLLVASPSVFGACPTMPANKACIQWGASLGWTDGTPYGAGISVRYRVILVGATPVVLGETSSLEYRPQGLTLGTKCFYVITVLNTGAESAPSNTACKTLRFPGPTDGKIEGPTDGSIERPNP